MSAMSFSCAERKEKLTQTSIQRKHNPHGDVTHGSLSADRQAARMARTSARDAIAILARGDQSCLISSRLFSVEALSHEHPESS